MQTIANVGALVNIYLDPYQHRCTDPFKTSIFLVLKSPPFWALKISNCFGRFHLKLQFWHFRAAQPVLGASFMAL